MGAPTSAPRPPAWLGSLVDDAPDVVAVWMAMDGDFAGLLAARREMRRRVTRDSAAAVLAQQDAIAEALAAVLRDLPEAALRAPGGEEDWNVAQAFAHTTAARRFLPAWAAMAAADEWPVDRPPVVIPSVPGPPDASVEELLTLLAKSRRSQERSAAQIAGHETRRCPLDHPLVGHLRCGDWLLFAGVHDLMHLEQLHRIVGSNGSARPAPRSPVA
jgi:DinB superfamily